jgi:hypothetical protein
MKKLLSYCFSGGVLRVFTILGLGFVVLGISAYVVANFQQSSKVSTEGTIVKIEHVRHNTAQALIQFQTLDGSIIQFDETLSEQDHFYSANELITVWYDNANPQQSASTFTPSDWYLGCVIFIILGLCFCCIAPTTYFFEQQQFSWSFFKGSSWVYIFPAIGVFLLLLSAYLAYNKQGEQANSTQYTATVVDLLPGRKTLYPLYQIILPPNDTILLKDKVGSYPPAHNLGDTVRIYADIQSHTATEVGVSSWLVEIIVGIVGVVFLGLGILVVRVFKK